jgi:hypothetical protein
VPLRSKGEPSYIITVASAASAWKSMFHTTQLVVQ